jgi:hypothetical protein
MINFLINGDTYLYVGLYFIDFIICMILLGLFYMYADKANTNDNRLKRYFIMTRSQNGAQISSKEDGSS